MKRNGNNLATRTQARESVIGYCMLTDLEMKGIKFVDEILEDKKKKSTKRICF